MKSLLLAVLFVVACGPPKPVSGVVIEKRDEPAYVMWSTTCVPVGKAIICTPHLLPMPERWLVVVRTIEGHDDTIAVSESNWEALEVGDAVDGLVGT